MDTVILAIQMFGNALLFLIFVGVVISWLPIDRGNIFVRTVHMLTEPILGPIRKLIYKSPIGGPGMMLDFSAIIAWILIETLVFVLTSILKSVGG